MVYRCITGFVGLLNESHSRINFGTISYNRYAILDNCNITSASACIQQGSIRTVKLSRHNLGI
jgi:hypothetical protein